MRTNRHKYVLLAAVFIILVQGMIGTASAHATGSAAAFSTPAEGPGYTAEKTEGSGHLEAAELGRSLALWWIIPFGGILLSIALFPLFAPEFWHKHFPKVSIFWSLVLAIPFIIALKGEALYQIFEIYLLDYFPFIILLWALFTVSGGIYIKGTLKGSPRLNLIFLLIGTVLASWIGTTGASMLLIRPVLRANAWRKYKVHVVIFFIFLVSNIGGSLTPLGDPPLFLGFLHGVPFFWTFNLFVEMAFLVAALLVIFYALDSFYYRRESPRQEDVKREPLEIQGLHNIIFLLGIIGAVLMSGLWHPGSVSILGVGVKIESLIRDAVMIIMGLLSLKSTSSEIHRENEFTWFPIKEVGYLFAGIFMTIIPALAILKAGEEGALGVIMKSMESPYHYFWVTGLLSSFLDNAPTYLTFLNTVLGKFFSSLPEQEAVNMLIINNASFLKAISTGAVFMGANTYIGNAPNFMVKSIAEEAGIRMPSFFGYMIKYSIPILIPLFILVTLIFFS